MHIGKHLLLGWSVFFATMSASAGPRDTPQLKQMEVFVGSWHVDGQVRAPDKSEVQTKGATEVVWTLGDRWIRLDSHALAAGQPPYAVTVYIAWNDEERAYNAIAINNLAARPVVYTGQWIDDRRLRFSGHVGRNVLQRVDYNILPGGMIGFAAANSVDEGRTFVTHATATWRPAAPTKVAP